MVKKCPFCGRTFDVKTRQSYCSEECKSKDMRSSRSCRKREIRTGPSPERKQFFEEKLKESKSGWMTYGQLQEKETLEKIVPKINVEQILAEIRENNARIAAEKNALDTEVTLAL